MARTRRATVGPACAPFCRLRSSWCCCCCCRRCSRRALVPLLRPPAAAPAAFTAPSAARLHRRGAQGACSPSRRCAAHPEFSGRQLRLDGYWRDSATGMTVLKRVGIVYNLEDDTMSVKVTADKARGIPETTLLRSHLVPRPHAGGEYTWRDLGPGSDVNLFGRLIHIVSADKVSRMFMDRQAKLEGGSFRDNEELPLELQVRQPNIIAATVYGLILRGVLPDVASRNRPLSMKDGGPPSVTTLGVASCWRVWVLWTGSSKTWRSSCSMTG